MNKKILIGILLVLFLVLVFVLLQKEPQEVMITTDKPEYRLGEDLTITINVENNLTDSICFSPLCSSFGLLEKKNGEWENLPFEECQKPYRAEECIEPKQVKAFEFSTLPELKPGLYRIPVFFCINCEADQTFEEDSRFYSNEFTIK